jgi:hypothetical protein
MTNWRPRSSNLSSLISHLSFVICHADELRASLPVYLVRSARTVWSSAPLLANWIHSKAQQAIAASAEAAKTRIAIHSNLLSRGEAASAQSFHKRVSGSASALGRLSNDCSVAAGGRFSFNRRSDRLGSARIKKSAVVIMSDSLCWIVLVHGAANAALDH